MTCIVGVTDGETVTIGGDSAGVSGWDLTVRADAKVWATKGWAFGFTTSFRMGQILRWSFEPPDLGGVPLERYMATTFVDSIRQCLKDGGWAKVESGREEGGSFLVGHAGRLFEVRDDFQVGESVVPFAAVGCGASYALGALHVVEDINTEKCVLRALEVAAHCSAGVRGPFHLVTTEPTAKEPA
jgi:hypothetical protein